MTYMFFCANFNQDISNWKINANKNNVAGMFTRCSIEEKYKPVLPE